MRRLITHGRRLDRPGSARLCSVVSSRALKPFLLLCAVVLLTGMNGQCNGLSLPGAPSCGSVGVPSVVVTVTDQDGATLPAATIAFGINGGQPFFTSCEGNCENFPIAFNTLGRFDITVSAPGRLNEFRTATVTSPDGCTPDTQTMTIALSPDDTVAVLAGAWETTNLFGRSILRFGDGGEIIGAILFDRTIAGDGNFYVSYNGRQIRGVPGQLVASAFAQDPIRLGDRFDFSTQTLGFPVGFEDATMTPNGLTLVGTLRGLPPGTPVVYSRLSNIPASLLSP